MATTPNNRNSDRSQTRKALPGGRSPLPGRHRTGARPPNFIEQARGQPQARPKSRPPGTGAGRGTPAARRTPALRIDETQRAPQPMPPQPTARRPASTIDELVPQIVRFAIKKDEGLTGTEFEEKLLPRVKAMIPTEQQGNERDVLQQYMLNIAHSLYVAIIVGQFSARPLLCGVRAAELAADLTERVLHQVGALKDKRMVAIRCANLLVGLTLYTVRFLETTTLSSQSLKGFTDNFERAVITTYGLKTQAESTGGAPWTRQKGNPLEARVGQAVNTMSGMFGDYIGQYGGSMDEKEHEEVLREFNGFMERFAPYIEGGKSADERRRRLAKQTAAIPRPGKVEPLEVKDVRARPAGVEIALTDGRTLFVSRNDARRIGSAAEAESEDTAKRDREALEAKLKAAPEKN